MSNTIVNTNVAALNSHRQILSVGGRQARSAERLSSGMRINRAADDAAGLAISEGMRNQIRGLDQSVRNSQDGISLVQTAEGALEEVHRMGERMRQLTVQAANDTNDENDRAAILLEIDQLGQDIDRIINDTEFNGMNLLGGDRGSLGEGIRRSASNTFNAARDQYNIDVQTRNAAVQNANDTFATNERVANLTRQANDATANAAHAESIAEATSVRQDAIGIAQVALQEATSAVNSMPMVTAADVAAREAAMAQAELTFAEAVAAAEYAFIGARNVADGIRAEALATNASTQGNVLTEANNDRLSATANANNAHSAAQSTFDNARQTHALSTNGLSSVSASTFGVQSGANSLQRIDIQLNNIQVYADQLGTNIWNAHDSGARISEGLDHIDSFISSVSEQRATLGAYQNRLEHTINSLRVTSENLSAANSRIRDTDMAAEMMQFTQANVLQQAGMSMLAQANMAPQNVLQLVG